MTDVTSSKPEQTKERRGKPIRFPQRWHWVLVIIIVLSIGFLMFRTTRPTLRHQGKSIDYWFERLPHTHVGKSSGSFSYQTLHSYSLGGNPLEGGVTISIYPGESKNASLAFKEFGTNAIPYLISKLQETNSPVEIRLWKIFTKMGINPKYFPFETPLIDNFRAVTALKSFDVLPSFAMRQLRLLTNSPNARIRLNAEGLVYHHEGFQGKAQ